MVAEEDSGDENDWRCLRTLSTKQLAESTSQLGPEENELQLRGMGGEQDQELDDEQALPIREECDEGKRNSGKVADVMGDENEMADAGEETSSDKVDDDNPATTLLSQRKEFPKQSRDRPPVNKTVSETASTERASARIDTTDVESFVDKHREQLIQRVSSVMEIAGGLKCWNMISDEMYNYIHVEPSLYKQMRLLYDAFHSGERAVKAKFYKILKEKQPFKVDDLESGSSWA
ncbi:hypothetical protein HF521_013578 [Silurus meridionalis]|uniref:CARD domain-containing protein n=1 Tax=Silurus meridionalis TaxID=175797 RepID=A0A8T0ABX0_SILME|nr:hypothetical protein HF521_013578 [Silurus meridionalis]